MAKATPEAFVSYSRTDEAFVRRLLHEMDAQRVPYWSDRMIPLGALWIDEIETAMKRASVFVLVISSSFQASEYAQFEAGIAVGRAQQSRALIVPILLPGAQLPTALRGYQALRADSLTVADIAGRPKAVVAATGQIGDPVLHELRLFVSSPADVTAEREVVSRVVEELNARMDKAEGVVLRRYTWESLPAIEARPQDALNDILRTSDIFLLILAARLGSPITADRSSRTEEEYLVVVENWRRTGRPQILCYLKTSPVKPSSINELDQLRRVLTFSDQLRRDHLLHEFESIGDFEAAVRLHLTKIIHSFKSPLTGD